MKQLLEKHFGKFWLAIVFAFLYMPLLFMIVFSFNSTRQDARFTGFSLRWYEALTQDDRIVEGFSLSLKVASDHRCAVGRARHVRCFRAGALPALSRAHGILWHGQCAAGDARGDDRPVAAAADGWVARTLFGWPERGC